MSAQTIKPGDYRYRISSTGASSAKLGPCQVCGQHCTEVFYQVEERAYVLDEFDQPWSEEEIKDGGLGWTAYECESYFGHEDCLRGRQR